MKNIYIFFVSIRRFIRDLNLVCSFVHTREREREIDFGLDSIGECFSMGLGAHSNLGLGRGVS